MTLGFAGTLDRSAVVRAATLVHDLVRRSEVEWAWTRESSCAGLTVGGLAPTSSSSRGSSCGS